MAKITFMGAGSTVFARNVLGDCMCSPSLCDSEIALYDINGQRLEDSQVILSAINQNVNQGRAKIKTYLGEENRKEALKGADFVVNAIQVGGYDPCTEKIWSSSDYCRQSGYRRHYERPSYHSSIRRLCQRYGRGMP